VVQNEMDLAALIEHAGDEPLRESLRQALVAADQPPVAATLAPLIARLGTLAACAVDPSASAVPVSYSLVPKAALTPCADLPALPAAQCGSVLVDLDRSHPSSG
jgi:hypothetical protein